MATITASSAAITIQLPARTIGLDPDCAATTMDEV
jgi:hypothetical protein